MRLLRAAWQNYLRGFWPTMLHRGPSAASKLAVERSRPSCPAVQHVEVFLWSRDAPAGCSFHRAKCWSLRATSPTTSSLPTSSTVYFAKRIRNCPAPSQLATAVTHLRPSFCPHDLCDATIAPRPIDCHLRRTPAWGNYRFLTSSGSLPWTRRLYCTHSRPLLPPTKSRDPSGPEATGAAKRPSAAGRERLPGRTSTRAQPWGSSKISPDGCRPPRRVWTSLTTYHAARRRHRRG